MGTYTPCSSRGSPFNHRVKSISTSTFKPEEVAHLLKEGGNEVRSLAVIKELWANQRALQRMGLIWRGKLLRNTMKPRAGDLARIQEVMRQTYIEKKFYVPPSVALKNVSTKERVKRGTDPLTGGSSRGSLPKRHS